ncbi:MAG: hypothetical protein HDR29_04630 [Lachnospiraceae bacterium]|nr:hypothetical protein [Lachnospiraceae bacterium]
MTSKNGRLEVAILSMDMETGMVKIEVKEGKLPWVIGSGTIAAGIVIGILSVVYAKNPGYINNSFLVVLAIIFAGAMMCLCAKNRGITVQDEKLCYKNCFGKKKTFALSDIGYCSVALESGSSRDYLILYDISGNKLCKLEFNMKNTDIFLRYLVDNEIKIECSKKSDMYLKWMVNTRPIALGEVRTVLKEVCDKADRLIAEWIKRNENFGAQWKFGLAFYMEDKFGKEKQLWEQEGAPAEVIDVLWDDIRIELSGNFAEDRKIILPEGLFVVIEGYLQKDGKFVIDRKDRAVFVAAELMHVAKSMNMEEELKLYFCGDALEHISEQLLYYEKVLPRRRYHTGELELRHELYLEK